MSKITAILKSVSETITRFVKSNFTISEARFTALLLVLIVCDQCTSRLCFYYMDSLTDFFALSLTEWYWYFRDVFCWTILLATPFLLFGKHSRWIYYPFICLFVLAEIATVFTWANFRMQLDGDWIGIVLSSNPEEFAPYVKRWSSVLYILFFAGLIYLIHRFVSCLKSSTCSKQRALTGLSLIALFCALMPLKTTFTNSPSFFLIIDSVANWRHYKRLAKMKTAPKIPEDLEPAITTPSSVLGVVVVGESATRNNWSLYGYKNKTTPRMDEIKDELIVFTDLVAPVSYTAKAIELIFTMSTVEDPDDPKCNYAQMLKHIGYDVSLYSAHERWGRWDGVESFIFAGANPLVFIGEENDTGEPLYDYALLKYLDRDIASQTNNMVTILHLYGSHFPFQHRTPKTNRPPELERFLNETTFPNEDTKYYDASIFLTDMLLGETIDKLKKRGGLNWMIYLSDHGESYDKGVNRLSTDRNVWEVPMIIWLSKDFKTKFPEITASLRDASTKPLQSDELLAGFLRIAYGKGWLIETEKDFLSKKFKPRFPRVIEGGKRIYPGDNPETERSDP